MMPESRRGAQGFECPPSRRFQRNKMLEATIPERFGRSMACNEFEGTVTALLLTHALL